MIIIQANDQANFRDIIMRLAARILDF